MFGVHLKTRRKKLKIFFCVKMNLVEQESYKYTQTYEQLWPTHHAVAKRNGTQTSQHAKSTCSHNFVSPIWFLLMSDYCDHLRIHFLLLWHLIVKQKVIWLQLKFAPDWKFLSSEDFSKIRNRCRSSAQQISIDIGLSKPIIYGRVFSLIRVRRRLFGVEYSRDPIRSNWYTATYSTAYFSSNWHSFGHHE